MTYVLFTAWTAIIFLMGFVFSMWGVKNKAREINEGLHTNEERWSIFYKWIKK